MFDPSGALQEPCRGHLIFTLHVLLQVVDSLDVSPHGTRVGLVQYSSRVRTEFPLHRYHTADDIKAAVMKVRGQRPGRNLGGSQLRTRRAGAGYH